MKFADRDDVVSRFEGTFPSDRLAWVDVRLTDVENALMGAVAELRKPIEDIQSRAELRDDDTYLDRVKSLVCDKLLQLFRNPGGLSQQMQMVDDVQESRSYSRIPSSVGISFTVEELSGIMVCQGSRSVQLVAWDDDYRHQHWPSV